MNVTNFAAITNGVSGTASFTSSSFWTFETFRLSGQCVVSSGSLVGNFSLQVSNDKAIGAFQNLFQPTNWASLGSTTMLLNCSTTAAIRNFMFPTTEVAYQYARIQFTDLSAGAAVGVFSFNVNAFAL